LICTLLCACQKHEDVFFDTPFVYISDENGASSSAIDSAADRYLTVLYIYLDASSNHFTSDVSVSYDTVVGSGLKDGVDFIIQSTTASPVVFSPGIYRMPVRLQWLKNQAFDPSADNTLTIRLTGCSLDGAAIGMPGPGSLKKEYLFTKK